MHLSAATVARALEILRPKPLGIIDFHDAMWVDRRDRDYATKARATRATLQPLIRAGLAAKYSNGGGPASDTFVATAPVETASALPVTTAVGPAVRPAVAAPMASSVGRGRTGGLDRGPNPSLASSTTRRSGTSPS